LSPLIEMMQGISSKPELGEQFDEDFKIACQEIEAGNTSQHTMGIEVIGIELLTSLSSVENIKEIKPKIIFFCIKILTFYVEGSEDEALTDKRQVLHPLTEDLPHRERSDPKDQQTLLPNGGSRSQR
jgi:hypothetical protein